ncbi:hypothetical protein QYM36_011374 [Artemia franciscana]|uniref:Uncharacterized protein n=1 Tax=Artemia franciscana TaxID=6661 RepID=A0AA88HV35_ARTSF|nr:hypothetical protein QYM36_011374 [Artemia franciscana]
MYSYKMKGIDLTKSTCEKDLGVILSLDLKPEKHIGLVVRKASNTLWLLSQSLRYLDNHSKISAYTSYVRPQLEYATVIWSPYLKKDIDRIERVQKRLVKGLQGFRNLPTHLNNARTKLNIGRTELNIVRTQMSIARTQLNIIRTQLNIIRNQLNVVRNQLNIIKTELNVIRTQLNIIRSQLNIVITQLIIIRTQLNIIRTQLNVVRTQLKII